MVVSDQIHNIMGGLENAGDVRLHNHRRKLKQRFDLVKKLGQGTYGKVQLGINKETGQEVAIKTIRKCKIETEADLIRIRREIQIMSSVRHPNIIHIYEVFENREKMVLVMEYAAGGELYDYLSERKVLSENEARRIFRQISTAIFYCHKHNICHRDLKLENILLDESGNAKIADFGLSNVFSYNALLSTFCGSPLYASPEIVKGTPYHGPEVDCWSLGVLLYTLVYGAMPFDGSNFKRLVRQISHGDYFEPKISSPASTLISEMLCVNPARRANISVICNHWWMNESYSEQCLDVAEELASQTPVRLDLLLSLAPSVNNEQTSVTNNQVATGEDVNGVGRPLRSQSLGSIAPQSVATYPIPEMPEPEERKRRDKDRSRSRRRKERSRSRSKKSSDENVATKKKAESGDETVNLNRTFTKMPTVEDNTVSENADRIEPEKDVVNESGESKSEDNEIKTVTKKLVKAERRNSKVFEIAEKFNGAAATEDKVKKTPSKIISPVVEVKTKNEPERKQSIKSPSINDSPLRKSIPERSVSNSEESPLDFPLASTVNLNKLVECAMRNEPFENDQVNECKRPILNTQRSHEETVKVKNAVKVIGNAISDGPSKASTLPRRKTSRAEIQLVTPQYVADNFKTEVEHFVNKPTVSHRTEVVFPVSAPLPPKPLSKQNNQSKEHIIPIQIEPEVVPSKLSSSQSISQSRGTIPRTSSSSLSRQSTADSDSGSNTSFTGEPIRKSPREVIIPIAVEGGGYVTPSTDAVTRASSVTESDDEAHGNRCFTLRSTKRRQPQATTHTISHTDTADSLSSDEDDNFQLLTAENLFSTLLSRVRSLTQRLNNEDVRRSSPFPRSLFAQHNTIFDEHPRNRLTETKSFSRPETAPWRRTNNPPRRDWYDIHNQASTEDISQRASNASTNYDNYKFPKSHSLSSSQRRSSIDNLSVSLDDSTALNHIASTANSNSKDSHKSDKEITYPKLDTLQRSTTDNLDLKHSKSNINDEFENFFAKYKNPATTLGSRCHSFESRLHSQLPTCYPYESRRKSLGVSNKTPKLVSSIGDSKSESETGSVTDSEKVRDNINMAKLDAKPPIKKVSRFLRPDFYDTPREESKYVTNPSSVRERLLGQRRFTLSHDVSRSSSNTSLDNINYYMRSSSNDAIPVAGTDKYKKFDAVLERIAKIRERYSEPREVSSDEFKLNDNKNSILSNNTSQNYSLSTKDTNEDTTMNQNKNTKCEPSTIPNQNKISNTESYKHDTITNASKISNTESNKHDTIINQSTISNTESYRHDTIRNENELPNSKYCIDDNTNISVHANNEKSGHKISKVVEMDTPGCSSTNYASYTVTLRKNKRPEPVKQQTIGNARCSLLQKDVENNKSDEKIKKEQYNCNIKINTSADILSNNKKYAQNDHEKCFTNFSRTTESDIACSSNSNRNICSGSYSGTQFSVFENRDIGSKSFTRSKNNEINLSGRNINLDDGKLITSLENDEGECSNEESVMDRIRRRSYYSRFNLSRQRSSHNPQRSIPTYSRSLSADYRYRPPNLSRS